MNDIYMELVNKVENNTVNMERLEAVLEEVSEYFELAIKPGTWEADQFIRQLGHITLLIHVTEQLLSDSIKEANDIVKSAMQSIKAQKGGAV